MDKVQKLPDSQGVASPLGKIRREHPRGRNKMLLEKEKKRREHEDWEAVMRQELDESDHDTADDAPEESHRGHLLDQKV